MSKKGMALSVYPASNIMKELESRKMIWVVHVAHVGRDAKYIQTYGKEI